VFADPAIVATWIAAVHTGPDPSLEERVIEHYAGDMMSTERRDAAVRAHP